jgi:hypothetical protein
MSGWRLKRREDHLARSEREHSLGVKNEKPARM